MKYLLSILLALSLQSTAFAHDHNLATFSIYQKGGVWLLKIDFTTSTMLESLDLEGKLSDYSDKEIKESMIRYFKKNIDIKIDNWIDVVLDKGGIKYGSHSSEVIFLLKGFKEGWTSLNVEIKAFKENKKQSNLIRVIDSTGTYKAFLNSKNYFKKGFEKVTVESN